MIIPDFEDYIVEVLTVNKGNGVALTYSIYKDKFFEELEDLGYGCKELEM